MKNKLEVCLNSIIKTQKNKNYEIIIINKPSKDDTEFFIKNNFPFAKLITCNQFGVAKMRNIGIKNTESKYLLMLDADTEVLDDFYSLIKFMDKHLDTAAVGVKLLTSDKDLQYSCRTFYDLRTIIFRRTFLGRLFPEHQIIKKHLMMDWNHNYIRKVNWIQGAFFLMSRKAIEDIGFFDEFSPFGFEDVAWCMKAHKKGYSIYYFPEIKVIHHYQRTSTLIFNKRFWQHLISFLKFVFKYGLPKI